MWFLFVRLLIQKIVFLDFVTIGHVGTSSVNELIAHLVCHVGPTEVLYVRIALKHPEQRRVQGSVAAAHAFHYAVHIRVDDDRDFILHVSRIDDDVAVHKLSIMVS